MNNEIWSIVRGKMLKSTPEEKVRQSYVKYLIEDLKVDKKYIKEEKGIQIGSKKSAVRFVDLIIEKNNIIKEDVVVEFKEPRENLFEAKNQAISYAKQLNINHVIICKGLNNNDQIYFVKDKKNEKLWNETNNFINAFKNEEQITIKPFDKEGLLNTLSQLNDELRTNWGLNDFDAFREINKLIFCKIYAEKKYKDQLNHGPLNYSFIKENKFNKKGIGITNLFDELKHSYSENNVFGQNEEIELDIDAVELILKKLNNYNFLETKEDVKGMVYEHFISQELRGKLGQYFTPRIIIDFILNYLNIKPDDKICDPACGTGGFLINYFKGIREKLSQDKVKEVVNNIYGYDFNETLVKVAKMNMILHGDGHVNINKANSLLLKEENKYDFIVTNPPFGSDNVKMEIANKFTKLTDNSIKTRKTEILFLEKIYDMLKPNGKAGIVLPLGILNNKSNKNIRKFIIKYFNVELVFRIPRNLFFTAKTTIQTCILILKKKEFPKIDNYKTKMFYVEDKELTNYNEYIDITKEKFENVIKKNYEPDLEIDVSKNDEYKLDPGFYIVNDDDLINSGSIKVSDILEPYQEKINKNEIIVNNMLTINSIDSNGKVNLKSKINKSGSHYLVKKGTFFYSRLAIHKGSFVYWEKDPIVITNEYPTLKIKNNSMIHPKIIEIILKNKYFLDKYYWMSTGQGRTRLHINDFLNIKIPKLIIQRAISESKKLLSLFAEKKEIDKKIKNEMIEFNKSIF